MTINGVDFGHETADRAETLRREQIVNVMTDGTRRVRPLRPVEVSTTFRLPRLTQTQWNDLRTLIVSGAPEWASQTFTVVDDYGASYVCRLRGELSARRRLGRFWSVEIPVWIEA